MNLETLECYSNQLTALDLTKNTKLTYLNCKNNQLTALDLSKNKVETLYCDASVTKITCPTGFLPIDSVHFPDANFRSYLVWYNSDNYIFANNVQASITSLSPYNRKITTLKGIE